MPLSRSLFLTLVCCLACEVSFAWLRLIKVCEYSFTSAQKSQLVHLFLIKQGNLSPLTEFLLFSSPHSLYISQYQSLYIYHNWSLNNQLFQICKVCEIHGCICVFCSYVHFFITFFMSSLITHKCSLITLKRVFICYLL